MSLILSVIRYISSQIGGGRVRVLMKRRREELGLTQQEVADRAGMTRLTMYILREEDMNQA